MKPNRIAGWLIAGTLTLGTSFSASALEISNEHIGQAIGGVAGGLLGHQVGGGNGKTAATIVGALAGAYVGGRVANAYTAPRYYDGYRSSGYVPTGYSPAVAYPDGPAPRPVHRPRHRAKQCR